MRCGAVWCGAVRCGVVWCVVCALLSVCGVVLVRCGGLGRGQGRREEEGSCVVVVVVW